ncbi:VCBS repeat-containing protein [Candidatus Woesearchaeota archaeon]|nr:VCBS repeat-containing protein [Candidatus Woesearchaeota archaeon]
MCQAGWSERSKHAAIGNFDDDIDLEIATHHGCTSIAAYNKDGSLVPGSVRDTGAMLWASLASGDINNDGFDEIVAAGSNILTGYNGGVYVFGKDGLLEGWPQFTDRAFTASPALGDVNGDGFLDIAISDWSGFTHVLDYRGKELPGWPRKNEIWPWSYRDISLAIADINGDNKADIISRGGGIQPALLQGGRMNSLGGIFAWNADGSPIGLNPVYPSNSLVMELWNGAPPVVTDLDNNGRVDIIGSSVAESAMCPLESDYPECSYKSKWRHSVYIWEFPSAFSERQSLWPIFQHDIQQTGSTPEPLPPLPPACIDSDGSNIFTQGTATFNDAVFTDECSASSNQVLEKLCIIDENGNLAMSSTPFNCPEPDCTNGACISRIYDRKFEQKLVTPISSGWVNAKPPVGKWGITRGASISKPKGESDNVMVTDVNAKNKKTIPSDGASAVQIITAEPGKKYRVTVSAKAVSKSKTVPAIVHVNPLDDKFEWLSLTSERIISGFKNGKWEAKSVDIAAPERTAYLKISLVNVRNIDGITYWDDIDVEEIK